MAESNSKEKVVEILGALAAARTKEGKEFNAKAYLKAAEIVSKLENINLPQKELEKIPGIGKKTASIIFEIVNTGSFSEYEQLNVPPPEKTSDQKEEESVRLEFQKIEGVGPVTSKKWYDSGYRSFDDLKKSNLKLTKNQEFSLNHIEDLSSRIPRSEIALFEMSLQQHLKGIKFVIAGSYRRGNETSGDMDVLILLPNNQNKEKFIEWLVSWPLLRHVFGNGPVKIRCAASLDGSKMRQVDFELVDSEEEWPFALLYFTGSKDHNIIMRGQAKDLGYSLNQRGFYDENDNKLNFNLKTEADVYHFLAKEMAKKHLINIEKLSEDEIFDKVGIKYLTPEQRNL